MINKLQKRFILIAMSSVALVIIVLVGSINIVNYKNVRSSADIRLDMLQMTVDRMPVITPFPGESFPMLSPEAPFESRYFSVYISPDGTPLSVDISHIAAIDTENAYSLAADLYKSRKTEGITGIYAYRLTSSDEGMLYIFLDHSRELDTYYSFLYASILISISSFAAVFILLLIFSRAAVMPIAESYEKQRRFITDAGHELKTPLSIIRAANEVIELENGESRWTASINNQVNRLSDLTNKLVILSKMSETNGIEASVFSISDTLLECVSGFEAVEFSRNKEIRTAISRDVSYRGDKKAIIQLFSILTDNALKYSPEKGIIDISLRKNGRDIIISFSNQAENVAVGNNNVLFERFYRPDGARNSESGGHGIGLSVAKAIVDAHKGKISAKSPDGKSLRITIIL